MRYFIDGYNLLFSPFFEASDPLKDFLKMSLRERRDALLSFLMKKTSLNTLQFTVVFDAPLSSTTPLLYDQYWPFEVLYSPAGLTADRWFLERASYSALSRECVVSQDKRLIKELRQLGVSTADFTTFFQRLNKSIGPNHTPVRGGSRESHYIEIFQARYRDLYL